MLASLNFRRVVLVGVAGIATGVGTGCKSEPKRAVDPTAAAFEDFAKRVDGYVKLRKPLVDSVGQLDPTKSQPEIAARSNALATAIIAARSQAKAGDIFTPEVSTILATLIKEEYRRRSEPVQETRQDQ